MTENKKILQLTDNHRIDVDDPSEVDCVHAMYPELDTIDVVEVIQLIGPSRGKVLEYLNNRYRATG